MCVCVCFIYRCSNGISCCVFASNNLSLTLYISLLFVVYNSSNKPYYKRNVSPKLSSVFEVFECVSIYTIYDIFPRLIPTFHNYHRHPALIHPTPHPHSHPCRAHINISFRFSLILSGEFHPRPTGTNRPTNPKLFVCSQIIDCNGSSPTAPPSDHQ